MGSLPVIDWKGAEASRGGFFFLLLQGLDVSRGIYQTVFALLFIFRCYLFPLRSYLIPL